MALRYHSQHKGNEIADTYATEDLGYGEQESYGTNKPVLLKRKAAEKATRHWRDCITEPSRGGELSTSPPRSETKDQNGAPGHTKGGS